MIDLLHYRGELQAELHNILQYWTTESIDPKTEQFYGEIDFFGNKKPDSPKCIVLYARLMWTFAAVSSFYKSTEYLVFANTCRKYIDAHFFDKKHGGYFWQVTSKGKPLDVKKQVYAQAFVMYAYAELYNVSADEKCLTRAMDVFYSLETRCYDSEFGGYFESFTQDWQLPEDYRLSDCDPNLPKGLNTHIHILEAYTRLYQVTKNPHVKGALSNLLQILLQKGIDTNGHLIMYHTREWNPVSKFFSFGHDIEASWMFYEAAVTIGNQELIERLNIISIKMIETFCTQALSDSGAVKHECDYASSECDEDNYWWIQVEAMYGLINAYGITKDEKYLDKVITIWNYINSYFIDRKNGEWYRRISKDKKPYKTDYKQGAWKTPYHNTRAIMHTIKNIQKIIQGEQ